MHTYVYPLSCCKHNLGCKSIETTGISEDSCNLCKEKSSEGEIARAKAQFKAGLLMSLESPSARCEQVASQIFAFGRVLPLAELVRRIEGVRKADLSRFAKTVLGAKRPSVAALGPVRALEPYERLAARFG